MKPLKGLATAIMILLGITALVALFAAFAYFNRASVLDDLANKTIQDVEDADDFVGAANGFFSLMSIATAVVWIIWQFRHAKNAVALRGPTGLAPGWAIGGWFIPVGNLVLPQMQLMQAAKASDPDLAPGQPTANGRAPGALIAWWVLLVLAAVMNFGASVVRGPGSDDFDFDPDNFMQGDRIAAFAMMVFIAAAIAGIFLVKELSDRQARAMGVAGGGQAAPSQYQQAHQPPQQQWQQPAPPPPPAQPQPQQWQPPPPPPPPPPQ